MLKLSYRNKLRLKQTAKTVGIVLLVLLLLVSVYLIYLQRYVVYSRDGVRFDFSQTTDSIPVSQTTPDSDTQTARQVQIEYADDTDESYQALRKLSGYYITQEMLKQSPDQVLEQLNSITDVGPVLIELKSKAGSFLYPTRITDAETAQADTEKVDQIISRLRTRGFTLIAKIPAFADSYFAAENPACALQMESGVLWADSSYTYWLDPANSLVLDYLQQICKELSSLGFSEVVFDQFYFPVSGEIAYSSSLTKTEIIEQAAHELENAFTGSNLIISFSVNSTTFPVESTVGRLYFQDVVGSGVEAIAMAADAVVSDPASQIVFLADTHDTRFDDYSILRPLWSDESAQPTPAQQPTP